MVPKVPKKALRSIGEGPGAVPQGPERARFESPCRIRSENLGHDSRSGQRSSRSRRGCAVTTTGVSVSLAPKDPRAVSVDAHLTQSQGLSLFDGWRRRGYQRMNSAPPENLALITR